MSISTLAELKTQVHSFLARATILDYVGVDNVENLILLGEKWLFRKARTPEMETDLNVTISSGVATVPADYAALKHARIDGSPTRYLRVKPSEWIYQQYPLRSSDTKPSFIGRDGSTFVFGPFPDSDYTVKGIYYAKPTSVLSSANTLFTANPDLYLFASLAEAEVFVKNDKRVAMWVAKRNLILADINGEAEEGEYGEAPSISVA